MGEGEGGRTEWRSGVGEGGRGGDKGLLTGLVVDLYVSYNTRNNPKFSVGFKIKLQESTGSKTKYVFEKRKIRF